MLTVLEYGNFIDTKCSSSLKQKFEAEDFDLNDFWIRHKDEYPTILLRRLLQF